MRNDEIYLVAFLGGAVLLGLTIASLRSAARDRQMRHAERLKAIENGLILDDLDEERRIRSGMLKLAAGLGILVPLVAVVCAAAAVINMPTQVTSTAAVFLIWTGAASICVAGIVSGAWLANATMTRLRPGGQSSVRSTPPLAWAYERREAAAAR
jgi:hypothetical protein